MTKLLVTVDIVLFTIRDRKLHLLLIRRLARPFENRYALQLYTFGDPKRDPRGRVVTVAYYALVPHDQALRAGTDAADAAWFPVTDLPPLAFDHRKIAEYAHQRLRNKLDYTNVGFELLPKEFTLTELQLVHEAILVRNLDKRNFRRKIIQKGIVKPTKEWRETGRKPAQLYRFSQYRNAN